MRPLQYVEIKQERYCQVMNQTVSSKHILTSTKRTNPTHIVQHMNLHSKIYLKLSQTLLPTLNTHKPKYATTT